MCFKTFEILDGKGPTSTSEFKQKENGNATSLGLQVKVQVEEIKNEWCCYTTEEGTRYYHNAATETSTWENHLLACCEASPQNFKHGDEDSSMSFLGADLNVLLSFPAL